MRSGSRSQGYTVIETMLFLAISGFMFVLAANFINGRQGRAEFRQGMNELDAKVRQVINDVGNGYYPSNQDFKCEASDTPLTPPTISTATSNNLGTNKGCVFLGKVISFDKADGTNTAYSVYTVFGRQFVGSQKQASVPTNFSQAQPKVAYDSTNGFSLTEKLDIKWGMKVTKFSNKGSAIRGLGFYTSFGQYEAGNALSSGSQEVVVVPITAADGANDASMASAIQGQTVDSNVDANPDVLVCLEGGNGQWGTLKFGGSGGQRLSTSIQVYNSQPGACT